MNYQQIDEQANCINMVLVDGFCERGYKGEYCAPHPLYIRRKKLATNVPIIAAVAV